MKDDGIIELLQSRDEKAIEMTAERYGRYCMQIAMNILASVQDSEECLSSLVEQHPTRAPESPAGISRADRAESVH